MFSDKASVFFFNNRRKGVWWWDMIDLKTAGYRNTICSLIRHYWFRAGSPINVLPTCTSFLTVLWPAFTINIRSLMHLCTLMLMLWARTCPVNECIKLEWNRTYGLALMLIQKSMGHTQQRITARPAQPHTCQDLV